jgi:HAE1 family hydrophobic/amphiphilic exporter-1
MSLSDISIQRPVATSMAFLGIVGFGTAAYLNMSVDFLPPVQFPELVIRTRLPGASPEEVEEAVTMPIESLVATVPGVKGSSSISRESVSIISIRFSWGTDMKYTLPAVREKLDLIMGTLPRGAGRPGILMISPESEPIMRIAISTEFPGPTGARMPGESEAEGGLAALSALHEVARGIVKKRIEQADGVARATVIGGTERQIHVELDRIKLESLGLHSNQVAEALAGASGSFPGGMVRNGQVRYSLRILGALHGTGEIRDIIISHSRTGRAVRIRDIAGVTDAYTRSMGIARYNGNEVVIVEVLKDAGANTVTVSARVHRVIEELRREHPGLRIAILFEQSEFIAASINDVQWEMIAGAGLAFLALMVFLGEPRSLLAVGLTIPLSVLATFIVMYFLHIDLNIMSLAGLALGIGMLGDNALIVVEHMVRRGDHAPDERRRITGALSASTLTNIAVFLPVLLIEGAWSELFRDTAVTMSVSLIVSLLIAVTLVPLLFQWHSPISSTKNRSLSSRLREISETLNASTRTYVDLYLGWALQHRVLVMLIVLGTVLVSAMLSLSIPSSDAPGIDRRHLILSLTMPGGTPRDMIMASTAAVEKTISALHGVTGVYSCIGFAGEHDYAGGNRSAISHASLEMEIDDRTGVDTLMHRTRGCLERLLEQYPGMEYNLGIRPTTFEKMLRSHQNDIVVAISGEDRLIRGSIAAEWLKHMRNVGGMVDVYPIPRGGRPEFRITIDREKVSQCGLSIKQTADHIVELLRGREVAAVEEVDSRVSIRVQLERDMTLQGLLSSRVLSGSRTVPVRDLVTCRQVGGVEEIRHEGQRRVHLLAGSVAGRSIAAVAHQLTVRAASTHLPEGYTISVGGKAADIRESVRGLLVVAALSVLLMYMILAVQYESLLSPVVILLTGPLAFTGAILAMVITGQDYNIMSLVGLVIMIGAVDNDAVIAVDVIDAFRRGGHALDAAIGLGMKERLRPILLTTGTTVLGILPLLWQGWTGTNMIRSLTIPLVGGLIASTGFTLVAIPVVYSLLRARKTGRG